eukprot:1568550-Amphidinium_carterae.2
MRINEKARSAIHAQGAWQRPSKAKEDTHAGDGDEGSVEGTGRFRLNRMPKPGRSTSCGLIWWGVVLISSYARTQSTIATSSAESEYYRACTCASEAVYVKELLKFLGEGVQTQLELDASSAISMGSRVGLGKARHVAVRYLWLQQLVADKTIKLVKVKGAQHPPDVNTKYLSKQGMIHAKAMLA